MKKRKGNKTEEGTIKKNHQPDQAHVMLTKISFWGEGWNNLHTPKSLLARKTLREILIVSFYATLSDI